MSVSFVNEFKGQCILRIEENAERIVKCMHELTEEEVWQRPNNQLSSVANLVLHLCGNVTQYAVASLGNTEDTRERSKEFSATGGYCKQELLGRFFAAINQAVSTIRATTEGEFMRVRFVQGFSMSGIGIVVHVTEHLSYHTGQVVFYTKLLTEKDLGFYAGLKLDAKNT